MIKVIFAILAFTISSGSILNAQAVGIGNDSPAPSAVLDIVDTERGILLPRLTTNQRISIVNPAQSLLVFDINTNSFWWRDANKWVELASSSNGLNDSDLDTGVYVEQTPDEDEVTINLAGQERARFFGDQLYLNNKLSLGTYAKRGMLTLRGPDDTEYGPSMYMYGTNADQIESGRLRFVEGTASSNWRGAFIHYDGFSNLLHLGAHNTSDNLASSDFNAMTIKRTNGFVGINQQNPQHRLSIDGSVKMTDNGITIETNQQEIILQAGASTIKVEANGNISISSPTGNISMDAKNINISASNDLVISAGNNISETSGGNIEHISNDNILTSATKSISINSGTNLLLDASNNTSLVSGASYSNIVNGDINQTANGNIELTSNTNILASASESMSVNTGLNLLLDASKNTSITSGVSFSNTAGDDIIETAGGDIELTANDNILASATESVNINAGSNLLLDATENMSLESGIHYTNSIGANATVTAGGNTKITSSGLLDLKGLFILLNAVTSSKGAARVSSEVLVTGNGDGNVTTGSNSVKIGN